MLESLQRLDTVLYKAERAASAALISVMGVVVFLDVVHRTSTRVDSLLANPLFVGAIGAGVGVLAMRTRDAENALAKGIGIGAGLGAAQWAFVKVLPNGLVWSQTFALGLTLWMGMAGACMAAYERRHLALDVGSKLWPESLQPKVAALGHWISAAFCLFLAWLGLRSVQGHFELWTSTDHAAGVLLGTPVPKWAVYASVPFGMAVLAWRLFLNGLLVITGREALGGDDTLKQLGIEEKQQ